MPTIRGRPAASMIKKSLFEPNKPHPVSKITRPRALKEEKTLMFPKSPAFSVGGDGMTAIKDNYQLKTAVDFCQQKNIPFKKEEATYYKINQAKQMHKNFTKTMNQFFETNRPAEITTGFEMLKAKKTMSREETGYVNEFYSDTRPIYLPQAAKEIMIKIQDDREDERQKIIKQQKKIARLQKIEGFDSSTIKESNAFDCNDLSSIFKKKSPKMHH